MRVAKLALVCALGVALVPSLGAAQEATDENQAAIDAAFDVLNEYMLTFNSRNAAAWAATLNFPHYRFSSGGVSEWETAEEYAGTVNLENLARAGWDHSHFIDLDVTLASPEKVHVLTTIRRYTENHEHLVTFKSLYIVTLEDGHWGVKARSSLAPGRRAQ